ncbi:MAG TPA: xanthine dehydrogenase family protein molybdopterin-binding subunit, partial [Candidatus Binatia bacterium]
MAETVGQSVPRIDGREKVTGRAVYASDLKLPNMAHGKILRSSYAHAKIVRIDTRRALALPGVVAVLTRENLMSGAPHYGTYIKDQPIVALDKVRYIGDVVAAVAATDERIADQALAAIEVDYEELPALLDVDAALA